MRKIARAAAGLAMLAAAGWSALWFTGKDEIEARLDAEIAALAARGIEVTHGTREIGGFPFRYAVRHEDVVYRDPGGIEVRLPEIETVVGAEDADRLVTRLPATFTAEITPARVEGDGRQSLRLDVEADGLVVVTEGLPGGEQNFEVRAASVLVATGSEAEKGTLAIEFVAPDHRGTLPDPVSGNPLTSVTRFGRVDLAFSGEGSGGGSLTFEMSVDAISLTGKSNMRSQADLAAMFAGPGAMLESVYQTGPSRYVVKTRQPGGARGGTLEGTNGASAGTITVREGRLELTASSRESKVSLAAEPPFEVTGGKPVGLAMRSVEAHYALPIAPTDGMAPFTLRFALDEVVADEVLWKLIDPNQALARDSARLIVDLEGSARVTGDIAGTRDGAAPPVEIGTVSVTALDLSALGASVKTRGDVEFLQPLWVPAGTLTVTLTNVLDTIGKLVEAGVLGPEVHQTAAILGAVYTRPGERPGELVSEVRMGIDGITVNGQPLSAGQ